MKIFFDFEFIETGAQHPIAPISIGMVREDGQMYYAEFANIPWHWANSWVLENIKPFMQGGELAKDHKTIVGDILEFCGQSPDFWAYFADYDWVIMCQLFGNMTDLPSSTHGWPFYCKDIKQYMWHTGVKRDDLNHIVNVDEHNALSDAIWNKKVFDFLEGREMQ